LKPPALLRSAGVVSSLTLLSRLLGLTRDVLMAGLFATGLSMSAFVVAFTIPNLFRRLFGEGALSAALVPVFIETRQQDGDTAAWQLTRTVLTAVTLTLTGLTLLGIAGIGLYRLLPDLSPKIALTLPLLQIMLPYMIFICLAALSMATLNASGRFAISAFAPSLLNIIWIAAVLFVCPRLGSDPTDQIYGVAWAVVFAGFIQWLIQQPALRALGYQPGWNTDFRQPRVRRVFTLMLPASLGMAVSQVHTLIDRLLAIWIGPWAPAALFFSERLIYLPQGLFATALGTVLLPTFSSHAAAADTARMRETMATALRHLFYIMIPAAVGLMVLARPIVQMIFEWRAFDATSTTYTTIALIVYAPGLLLFSLNKVLVPAFYGLQDTRTPVRIALISLLFKLALSLILIRVLPTAIKHAGLAAATVTAETFYGIVLAVLIHRRIGSPGWGVIAQSAARALAGAGIMAVTLWITYPHLTALTAAWPDKLAQIGAVLSAIALAITVYGISTWLLRSPELHGVAQALARKLKR
jgi:putative peptidoglycan lipid II flippase